MDPFEHFAKIALYKMSVCFQVQGFVLIFQLFWTCSSLTQHQKVPSFSLLYILNKHFLPWSQKESIEDTENAKKLICHLENNSVAPLTVTVNDAVTSLAPDSNANDGIKNSKGYTAKADNAVISKSLIKAKLVNIAL